MKTFIKSAGKEIDVDYAWWELENGSLKNISTPGPSVANILVKKTENSRFPERLINDEYFALVLHKDSKSSRIHLLVYLPAPKFERASEKKYRIDYTGQRTIRIGFAWEAQNDEDDLELKKRAIAFLEMDVEKLIEYFEPCFEFTYIAKVPQQPGFKIKIDQLEAAMKQLTASTVGGHDSSSLKPNKSGYWIVKDSLKSRRGIYDSIRKEPNIFVVLDRYICDAIIQTLPYRIQYVLSSVENHAEWRRIEYKNGSKNPKAITLTIIAVGLILLSFTII